MYDVLIVGAGPAGTACALALSQASHLRIGMLDKSPSFPRDKVCGDAIPGAAIRSLERLAQQLKLELPPLPVHEAIRHARFYGNRPRPLELTWVVPAYNSTRASFDAWLLDAVKQTDSVECHIATCVKTIDRRPEGLVVQTDRGTFETRLLIGCDGANSSVARALTPTRPDRHHQLAAVRAYFRGVKGLAPFTNDIYFLRRWQPGYLWVFPVGPDLFNVGFGMASAEVARRKINLTQSLAEAIAEHPRLADGFRDAEQMGRTLGFPLPIGSRTVPCHDDRLMLCGDAAALIDPIGGHGIDTAIRSGILAAQTALEGFRQNRLDAESLSPYAEALKREIRPKLLRNGYVLRLGGAAPWLMDVGVQLARVQALKRLAQSWL